MSFLDNIKDLYYGLEDGYYHFLDNIQDHIPVYKVVDPIDKVFPSFALLLIIVLIIGFLIFTNLIAIPATVTLTASFSDDVGNPIPQLPVQLVTGTQTIDKATDVTGNISFEVPSNSNVQVLVSLDGFGEIDETILIGEGDVHETFVLTALQLPKIKNIQFVDASNFPIHQKITLSVSCAQPGIEVAQDTVETDSDGKITLAEPVGCGALTVTVLGPSEFQSNSYVLQHPSNIFQLQAIDIPPPPPPNVLPLRVRIESEQGTLLTDLFFEVSLYKGEVFQLKKTTMNGTVRFDDLEPGVYRVTVQDPEGAYAGPGVENIVVNSNSPQNPIAITLTEQLQIQISVLIVEATTNQPISGATIVIRDAETIQELNRQAMGDDGEAVSFSWVQNIDLKIEAMAERYVSKSIETSQNSGMIIIELDEITPANSATVRVQVVDAVGDVVPNAQVFLRYEDSQAIAPYPPQISDLNGTVEFTGVQESELFAYAEKYPAAGSSASQEIVVGEKYELEVLLAIGSMELTINAWNENNELIPDSTAEIWDAENNFLGSYPLGNGSTIIPIKADKRIYVVVKNSEYFAYQTETFQLYKDNPITIDAILPSRLLGGGPKAVFMGVFDQQNNPVQSMQAGGTYYMRMQLRIPEGTNYTNAGIHFRVGASNTIENDNIRIIRVNVGNASLLKGSTFNAPLGQVIDLDPSNLTTGDAKWAEFSWLNPKPQAYNAVIEVHVKKETIMNTPIPFYYRAWSIQPTGGVLRDPVDEELGNGFETSSKHGLYANAHAVVSYFEGQDAECINNFCFSNLRVFDQTEGLYLLNTFGLPYETRINQPYQLSFILTNNSVANYENALLSIRALFDSKQDNQLKFTGYSITNASQHTIESTNPPNSEIVNIDVGEFKTNTGVSGWIDFDPTALNPTSIEIQLVYNGEIVVTKIIDFETLSDQEMKIDFQPAIVPAFTPTLTNAHITLNDPESEDHEMDLEDVLVTLTIEATDHSKTKQQQTTNSIGFVEFDLSSLAPNTKLKIEAEKPNYFAEPFKTHVDGNVLEF
ncbi:hypothetical protein KJ972_04135, partial [Candidatus Micrarchaeota archaeon]|nr:hypothetical protein [Candidatus Micrarchaeota archaeon]